MHISGLTIIRNAIINGYPIAEVIDNLKLISKEIIVLDGYSDDGTYEYLCTIPGIKIYQDKWNLSSKDGLEFAHITNLGLSRCSGDHIFYLQADEIMHDEDILKLPGMIGEYNAVNMRFKHIRYDFDYCLNGGYERAIRFFKKEGIYSHYDAYTFAGNTCPTLNTEMIVYHVGYVFIKNILQKMINHYTLFYKDAPSYKYRKELAEKYLIDLKNGKQLDKIQLARQLEPMYQLVRHETNIPKCLQRLQNANEYTFPIL